MWLALLASIVSATPSVAILDLDNATGDPAYDGAGAGIAGLLVTRFSRSDALSVVERDALQDVLREQRLSTSGAVDPATASRAGKLIGARYVVTGELFSVQLPALSVNLRVVDTQTAEVVAAHEVNGQVGDEGQQFFTLIDELSDELLAILDVTLPAGERAGWSALEHRELDAVIAYGRKLAAIGLDHPQALFRDTSKDYLDAPLSDRWLVLDNAGDELRMPELARRLGDTERIDLYGVRTREATARHRRNNRIWLGVGAGGLAIAATGFALGDDSPPGVAGLGTVIVVGSAGGLLANQLGRTQGIDALSWPSAFYTPQEADDAIARHNLALD